MGNIFCTLDRGNISLKPELHALISQQCEIDIENLRTLVLTTSDGTSIRLPPTGVSLTVTDEEYLGPTIDAKKRKLEFTPVAAPQPRPSVAISSKNLGTGVKDEDSPKLFVGPIPRTVSEEEIFKLFSTIAPIAELFPIRGKRSKFDGSSNHDGAAFVTYQTREAADAAIATFNAKNIFGTHPTEVKYATGEVERLENELFIGSLPLDPPEEELRCILSTCGNLRSLHIMKGKGSAFATYATRAQANDAITKLNGRVCVGTKPMAVRFSNREKTKAAGMSMGSAAASMNSGMVAAMQPSYSYQLPAAQPSFGSPGQVQFQGGLPMGMMGGGGPASQGMGQPMGLSGAMGYGNPFGSMQGL